MTSLIPESILALLGVTGGGGLLGVVKRNRDRSRMNQRRLEGDDDPDGYEGLMATVKDTRERVGVVEEKIDTAQRERKHEHEAVMDRIDDLADEE